jgi:hypothetical protein
VRHSLQRSDFAETFVLLRKTLRRFARSVKGEGLNLRKVEEIGLDLYVVTLLALISTYLLLRRGRQLMFVYYTVAYWLGLIASIIAQTFR